MRETTLIRYEHADTHTRGLLSIGGQALHTIEPPWKDNQIGESCIPTGKYECHMRKSPKYGFKYWLQDTDPRTFVLIHGGNLARHTMGCILPGMRKGKLSGQAAVLNSRRAVGLIHEYFQLEAFMLRIANDS